MTEKRRGSGKTLWIGVALLALAAIWCLVKLSSRESGGIPGATNADRVAFISSFGWEVGTVASDTREVRIPTEFDAAYEQYNAIQREQGFDLRKYRACCVNKFTYRVKNYEGDIPTVINLLVYEGEIIGADLSSLTADGFVTVLRR